MKVKIRMVHLGYIPYSIDFDKVEKWKSDLFEVISPICSSPIEDNSDGQQWEFSDERIRILLPEREGADILIAITNVPLQSKYYLRGFADNKVCMTYNARAEILKINNIPLENLILRILYFISFVYKYCGNHTPQSNEGRIDIIHDETRGCIFDFNADEKDILYSLNRPIICLSCIKKLTDNQIHPINKGLVNKVLKELKRIKKRLYFRLVDFVKSKPILAIIISSTAAIILGLIGSILATILWQKIINHWL